MGTEPGAGWLNHRQFMPVRQWAVRSMQTHSGYFRHAGPILFLCGAHQSKRRDYLAKHLRKKPGFNVFYAEAVWDQVRLQEPEGNALDLEGRLAAFADAVILIVESPGTFCELGAFALNDDLRKKLLPLLDKRHESASSFVATGPARWVNRDSLFRPCLWLDLDTLLTASEEIEERLRRIPARPLAAKHDIARDSRLMLLFLVDVATVFGPCTRVQIEILTKEVLGLATVVNYAFLLGLAVGLGMLACVQDHYYRPVVDGKLVPFHRPSRTVSIIGMRAQVTGVMQRIPLANDALRLMTAS